MSAGKPDYGLDAPGEVRKLLVRGSVLIALAIVLHIANGPNPVGSISFSVGITFLIVGAVMIWSSRVAKPRMRDRLLDLLPWRGDEKVLDVGCGRGLLLIGAAKRLKSGKATGVDIWRSEDLSNNGPEATLANAKAEGVAERIKIESADARKLPMANASVDTVLSSLVIHNIPSREDRVQALSEIVRVLKPGGHVAILDILHTGDYAKELQKQGLTDVNLSGLNLLWCLPTRYVTARKP
ncbi:MAG: class I SAM-dependent methyltransferase [Acidobacteriota bacterium]|nr:class I SAM-dependent methyltransferase [Acidobacteriota bacterium]